MDEGSPYILAWLCVRCRRPVTTFPESRRHGCQNCRVGGAWEGERISVPKGCLIVSDERPLEGL